jgi:uncharacterized protein
MPLQRLRDCLALSPKIAFAVLVGSRAKGLEHAQSDWDVAIAFVPELDPLERYELLSDLQLEISKQIQIHPDELDLIDIAQAGLAMREQIANEGMLLKGNNTLLWSQFLVRTWRELEMFSWEQSHGA